LTSIKGNQVGAAFWQTISGEHGLDSSGVYVYTSYNNARDFI
jgi:hypothetical protein